MTRRGPRRTGTLPGIERKWSTRVRRKYKASDHDHTARVPGEELRQPFTLTWRPLLIAAIPVALSAYYLSWVAPDLLPAPPDVRVPFPWASEFLQKVCSWCGRNRLEVVLMGTGLLAPGILCRMAARRERYCLRLAIVCSLALGFAYFNVSAPVDRLDKAVDEAIPADERVPRHRTSE